MGKKTHNVKCTTITKNNCLHKLTAHLILLFYLISLSNALLTGGLASNAALCLVEAGVLILALGGASINVLETF